MNSDCITVLGEKLTDYMEKDEQQPQRSEEAKPNFALEESFNFRPFSSFTCVNTEQ